MKAQTCRLGMIMTSSLGKMLDKAKNQGKPRRYLRNINVRWFGFDLSDVQEMRIADEEVDRYSIRKGDLVVCEGGEPGRCAIWCDEETVCFQKALHRVRFTEASDPRFYMYYLWMLAKSGMLAAYYTGTGIKHLTGESLKKLPVPVPPLAEQKRIVARIEELFSELDNGVETLKKTKQQLAVYRQSVLKAAFEGRITKHQHCDEKLDWALGGEINSLPTIPSEWRYIALSKLGELGRGKSKHRPRNDPKLFVGGKYPFLQTGDVKAAKQCIIEYSKMYGEFGLQQSKLWPKGTLCITIAANIAETAFLGIDACFPDSVVGFVPYECIDPKYIKYFIESQKLRLWAFAPATAQKNINLDTLENLIVPYCSLEEQRAVIAEIESRLSVCDSIEKTVDAALQQAESMRQSILKKAFEGVL